MLPVFKHFRASFTRCHVSGYVYSMKHEGHSINKVNFSVQKLYNSDRSLIFFFFFHHKSRPVAHNTFFFIGTFKPCASLEFFEGPNRWKSEGARSGLLGEWWSGSQPWLFKVSRLGCCEKPCVVMMQDDSFRLVISAFVFCLFWSVSAVCSSWHCSQSFFSQGIKWWLGLTHPKKTVCIIFLVNRWDLNFFTRELACFTPRPHFSLHPQHFSVRPLTKTCGTHHA